MSRMCICALASAGWTCCAGVIQAASSAMGPTDPLLRKAPAFPRTNGLDRGIQIRRALALETACGASIILQAPYAANGPIDGQALRQALSGRLSDYKIGRGTGRDRGCQYV